MTAQGLLMYFTEEQVRGLVVAVSERFPGVEMVFDTIPVWLSKKTLDGTRGFRKTEHYQAPPMPWGVGRGRLARLLRSWTPRITSVATQPYGFARGPGVALVQLCRLPTPLRNISPAVAHVRTSGSPL